jgi:hypothetical protein
MESRLIDLFKSTSLVLNVVPRSESVMCNIAYPATDVTHDNTIASAVILVVVITTVFNVCKLETDSVGNAHYNVVASSYALAVLSRLQLCCPCYDADHNDNAHVRHVTQSITDSLPHMGLDVYHGRHEVTRAVLHEYHKAIGTCDHVFGSKSKQNMMSSLELLDEEGSIQSQPMVGKLQRIISIGQFSITTCTMMTSLIIRYMATMRRSCIHNAVIPTCGWLPSVDRNLTATLSNNMDKSIDISVVTSFCEDTSLYHDLLLSGSVTAKFHLSTMTRFDAITKMQANVEGWTILYNGHSDPGSS